MHWIVVALDHGNRKDLRSTVRPAHRAYLRRDDLAARFLTGASIIDEFSGVMRGAELFHRTEIFALHADHVKSWRTIAGRIAS